MFFYDGSFVEFFRPYFDAFVGVNVCVCDILLIYNKLYFIVPALEVMSSSYFFYVHIVFFQYD